MGVYQRIIVGTDGSETSFRAVDRAAELARDAEATLYVITAYQPMNKDDVVRAQDKLGPDMAYQVVGSAPAEDTVSRGRDRARKAGATKVETQVLRGEAAPVLFEAVTSLGADLLVVGNRGLNTLAGRILGSVPAEVARHSSVDVLIVHTT
ncbi:MAG TPA: universal stress protein [Jatrophihabitantaceae bacterium]|nr:universal stress protein [Jatrophihabitantaceae bacterium]